MANLILTPKMESEILSLNKEGHKGNVIARIKNISTSSVSKCLRRNGIQVGATGRPNLYTANYDFFESIDNEVKAYFLGLLLADGCIYTKKWNYAMILNLHKKDSYILQKFMEQINYTGSLRIERNQAVLRISSKKLIADLSKYGIVDNKSHITYFPNIPEELHHHFIRGVFDGDGSICSGRGKNKQFNILGNETLIVKIQEVLVKECKLTTTKLHHCKHHTKNIVYIQYGGINNIASIASYLYKDATIFLTRKHSKFYDNG